MFNIQKTMLYFLLMLFISACDDGKDLNQPKPPFQEPVPEKTVYTNANLVYVGDDLGAEGSDLWVLTLYTDMELDETNNLIGPGKMLNVSLNVSFNPTQTPDLTMLESTYIEPTNTGDFSPGTFNPGYLLTIDLPGGKIEKPDGTFFGDIATGVTTFEADLLREGYCTLKEKGDGEFTITGILVGTDFTKRYFTFEGKPHIVNRADPKVPNSSLTEDLTLTTLTTSRLSDRGDAFILQDESYRLFELTLAESSVDFSTGWAKGNGKLLRIEIFVPWDTDVTNGIPEGTYTVTTREANNGIIRENIVPFNIVPGYPDQFTNSSGSWYQSLTDGVLSDYARIHGGTMQVERPDGSHRLTIRFIDSEEPAHKVNCVWETTVPIPVIK